MTNQLDNTTQEQIRKLIEAGLNEKEALIMNQIMGSPNTSIPDISKQTNIPRTTAQRVTESLVKKGLARWVLNQGGRALQATNFSKYLQDLEEKAQNINDSIQTFQELSQASVSKTSQVKPNVKYYEGVEGVKQLVWNTLSASTVLKVYTNAMRQEIFGKDWMTDYCIEFVKRKIQDRVLCDYKHANNSYQKYGGRKEYFAPVTDFYKNSDERVLKASVMKIRGETYIYDNTIAMYTWEEANLIGFEVESKYLVDTQNSVFDILWGMTTRDDHIDKILAKN